MKVRLQLQRNGTVVQEGVYNVTDAQTFGDACAQIWKQTFESRLLNASSVGALYDMLDESVLDQLQGAAITISKP